MTETYDLDRARTALRAAGMPNITLAAISAGILAAGLTLVIQPVEVAMYVFLMAILTPAAIACRATASIDRDICVRAPELFYDLSEYVRASGSFQKALKRASAGDYGTMSDEVRRILSEVEDEGYDLSTALKAMATRVNNAYITRSVSIINEALTSSPDAESVLKMVSAEGRLSLSLDAERKAGIASAIIVMYLTAFVFLAVVSLCISSFVPVSHQLQALTAGVPDLPENPVTAAMPYYVLSLSVALCSGLTIGAMRDNTIFAGMKDAAILVTATFLIYELIVFPGYDVMGAFGL
ncbi:MAG TPA: type II secretion system F family protein [Methanocella sp.]